MEHTPPPGEQPEEKNPYRRAARFDGAHAETRALQAYERTRRDLHRSPLETDISAFRLQLGNRIGDVAFLGWYVALIGRPPDEALEARLERHLAAGVRIELPEQVITMLKERRERTAELAPWVERRDGRITNVELYQRPEAEGEPRGKR